MAITRSLRDEYSLLDDVQPDDQYELADRRDAKQRVGKYHKDVGCESPFATGFNAWRWCVACRSLSADDLRGTFACAKLGNAIC